MESRDEETPLVDDNLVVQTPKKNHARDVHILSSAFLLVFLAYGAVQNLESTLNTVSLCSLLLHFRLQFLFSYVWLLRETEKDMILNVLYLEVYSFLFFLVKLHIFS